MHLLAILGCVTAALAAAVPEAVSVPPPNPLVKDAVEERALKVSVDMSQGTVVGASLLNVESFRGLPYAEPPVGPLRLKPPRRLTRDLGTVQATGLAPACPQMVISNDSMGLLGGILGTLLENPLLQVVTGQEDCLTVSVQRPAGAKAGDKLPVLFWIYGGGFQFGSTQMYDGTSLITAAVEQDQPFIFVAVNHRVGGFGFLPGAEVLKDGSSNLGLLDQRMGLEWVADNIEAFGGDPEKVTIWGESAGAISVFDQMALYGGNATYNGRDLFRGAIMNSGSIVPADPVDCPKGQQVYDTVVEEAGCKGAANTLDCLRKADYQVFLRAVNSLPGILSYNSVALSYLPRPDGEVLPDSPDRLAASGRYHAVPMIIGDLEDEGTLFSLFQTSVNTASEVVDYLSDLFFHNASKSQLQALVGTYSPLLTRGSPFRTGLLNEWYIGFKRLSAILGDLTFTLTRCVFLETTAAANPGVKSWSYLSSYNYGTPILGTFHAADLLQVFYGILPNNAGRSCRTYYYNFLYNLDPNVGFAKYAPWPEWKDAKQLMWFETASKNSYLADDFRAESYEFIRDNVGAFYI